MSQIEWAMWANEQAITSSSIVLLGGILSVAGQFNYWQFGVYAIIIGVLITALEWPRSKRKKGSTMERPFQRPFSIIVNKLGPAGRNYFIRFVAYLLLAVPCCFTLGTLTGAVCLLLTAAIYFIAAIKGEEWSTTAVKKATEEKTVKSLSPPKKPPPRLGHGSRSNSEVSIAEVSMSVIDDNTPTTSSGIAAKPTRPPPRPNLPATQQDKF